MELTQKAEGSSCLYCNSRHGCSADRVFVHRGTVNVVDGCGGVGIRVIVRNSSSSRYSTYNPVKSRIAELSHRVSKWGDIIIHLI